jgi:membrane-associated HD superfamily phosphohydrolase
MQNQGQQTNPQSSARTSAGRTDGSRPAPPEASRDEELKAEIQDDSDKLLRAVDEIRQLESEKRHLMMSTPEFHQTANRIERKAREVFGVAKAQREVGEALRTQSESIDDQARKEGDDS